MGTTTFADYARVVHQVYEAGSEHLRLLPSNLLDGWDAFVSQCEDGYGFDLSEYGNDIRIRTQIEFFLSASELHGFPEFQHLAARFEEIDERFRRLLLPNIVRPYAGTGWWERGVLRYAGRDYADDMQSLYGISIAPVENKSG